MRSMYSLFAAVGICVSQLGQAADFQSDFITVRTQGSGPDVVLTHGFASSATVWDSVVNDLKNRYRLHIVSIAGLPDMAAPRQAPKSYLDSVSDDISRYIREQNLQKPALIGHSMGGLLSLLTAAKTPQTGQVIAVDALPFFSLLFNPLATAEQSLPYALGWEQSTLALNEAQFAQQAGAANAILTQQSSKIPTLVQWAKDSDRKAYAQMMREVMSRDARSELAKVQAPLTVIYAFDEAMQRPVAQLEQLYKTTYTNAQQLTLKRINNSFHFIMWDQPERLNQNLRATLAGE